MTPSDFIRAAKLSVLTEAQNGADASYNYFLNEVNDNKKNETMLDRAHEILTKFYGDNISKEITSKYLEFLENDYCHELINGFRDSIPKSFLNLLDSNQVDCGLVEDYRPYCQCISLEKNYAILMSRGFTQILYSIIRTFCTLICFGEESGSSLEEVSSIMADDFFVFQKTYAISPRVNVEISKQQIVFANQICMYCELFFLFHEFSHIIIGSVDHKEVDRRKEEYLADSFAMKSMLSMGNTASELEILYLSCILALLVFCTLEELSLLPVGPTHPPCKQRIAYLQQELEKEYADKLFVDKITNFATIAESVFNQIFALITSGSECHKKIALELEKDLRLVLKKYCKSSYSLSDNTFAIPDYVNSSMELHDLFCKGHYQVIYKVMQLIVSELIGLIKATNHKYSDNLNNIPNEELNRYVEAFNSYKLIINFINELEGPLKTIFSSMLSST